MKLAQRLLVLFAMFAMTAFAVSCETTTEAPEEPVPPPDVTTLGGVAGFVYDASGVVVIVDKPSSAPGGATAIAGAEVRLQMVTDVDDAEVLSGSAGGFDISGLRPGLYDVEVRADPRSADPDFETQVTVVADKTITMGKTYAVSQSDALDALFAGSPARVATTAPEDYENALILGTAQPLPAGVQVHAMSMNGKTLVHETTAEEWFFFVDLVPFTAFTHSVEYAFVNAEDGSVQRFASDGQPMINGVPYWNTDSRFLVFNGDPMSEEFTMAPTSEVVQAPPAVEPGQPAPTQSSPAVGATARDSNPVPDAASDNPEDWIVLLLELDDRLDMLRNVGDMNDFFEAQGVPTINIFRASSWTKDRDGFKNFYDQLLAGITRRMDRRIKAGGKPTLFVYMVGHSDEAGFQGIRKKDGELFAWKAFNWKLETIKSCRTVVIWDTCYAQKHANDLSLLFEALTPDMRPELRIFAACKADEKSQGKPALFEWATNGQMRSEGIFTSRFLDHASIVNGDIAGVTDGSGNYIPELSWWVTSDLWQTPQIIELYGEPYWCETLETILEVDKTSLALALPGPVQGPCSRHVGDLSFTNPTRLDVDVVVESSDPSITVNPSDFFLSPGVSRSVSVFYNCSTPPPVNATLRFIATTSNAQKDTVTVDVRVTPPLGTGSREVRVRHPGPAGFGEYEVIFQMPVRAVVDHTTLIDKATGEAPPFLPWQEEGGLAAFSVVTEGFNDAVPPQWVYKFRVTDPPIGRGCDGCLPKDWVYTVYFYTE